MINLNRGGVGGPGWGAGACQRLEVLLQRVALDLKFRVLLNLSRARNLKTLRPKLQKVQEAPKFGKVQQK